MRILKRRRSLIKTVLAGTLIVATTIAMASPQQSWAMIAPAQVTDAAHGISEARAADLKTVQTALESKMLRQRLAELKLSPEQINHRLSQLSDAQVHQTAMQIHAISPGGDGGGIVITVLVIAILAALFVYVFRRA